MEAGAEGSSSEQPDHHGGSGQMTATALSFPRLGTLRGGWSPAGDRPPRGARNHLAEVGPDARYATPAGLRATLSLPIFNGGPGSPPGITHAHP